MSFIRRYNSFPSQQVISQIEGVVVIDLPPPASIEGINTGIVGAVGEFADFTYATTVDGSGNVSTKYEPVQVTSAQDMLDKVGGFDPSLGDFGGDDGNGFVAVANKRFAGLVLCPVNLASSKGVKVYRELPLCKSASDASPIVPLQAAAILAGTEFKSGANRVHIGASFSFLATGPIVQGLDGSQTAGGPGVLRELTSASSDFVSAGVQPGDAVVIGVFGGPGDEGTYRVVTVNSATSINVEALDGSAITWGGAAPVPFRIHPASTFDSGGNYTNASTSGYMIPARPLDASIAPATELTPAIAAPAQTATSCDPLAGLTMKTQEGVGNGLVYTAAVQGENVTGSGLDVAYSAALEAFLADSSPMRDVSIIYTARTNAVIRSSLKTHVKVASSQGIGRMAVMAPPINEVSQTAVLGSGTNGVGNTNFSRDERVTYCWPGVQTLVPQAAGVPVMTALGTMTTDGILDVRSDGWLAAVLSNLAAERNPGQAAEPVPTVLSPILGFQRGNLPAFAMSDYILFRQNGVVALKFDRTVGKVFQSGITTSLVSGQKNINRRRMADEIEDSIAAAYAQFVKLPLTNQLKDAIDGETAAYLEGLLSQTNPAAQRIAAYSVDSRSGNTPQLTAAGIHVVIVKVQMLATSDVIVLQAEVGPSVTITQQ